MHQIIPVSHLRIMLMTFSGFRRVPILILPFLKACTGFILVFSLTQASSLRDMELLRQQVFRIKNLPVPAVADQYQYTSSSSGVGSSGARTNSPDHDRFHHSPRHAQLAGSLHPGHLPMVIVGTKSDLTNEREVSRETATRYV
jgi:hypothetical protein